MQSSRILFLLSLAGLLGLASPAVASTITVFQDNFNSYNVATIDGQGPWTSFTLFGGVGTNFDVSTTYGVGGTKGAGGGPSSGATASMGSTVSTGALQLQADLYRTNTTGPSPQFWIHDPVSGVTASLQWEPGASAGAGGIHFEGLSLGEATNAHAVGFASGHLHVTLTIGLVAKTVAYSWYDADDPGNVARQGSVDLGTYTSAYAPSKVHIYQNAGSGNSGGFDNLTVTQTIPDPVPEPAALGLLALAGAAGALRRRRRASS